MARVGIASVETAAHANLATWQSTGSCGGFPSAAAGMPEMVSLHHATEGGINSEQCVG